MDVQVNDTLWSEYFNCWLRVVKITSDDDWEFVRPFDNLSKRGKEPLSWYWENSVVTRNRKRINPVKEEQK